jgi:hypothetical protein
MGDKAPVARLIRAAEGCSLHRLLYPSLAFPPLVHSLLPLRWVSSSLALSYERREVSLSASLLLPQPPIFPPAFVPRKFAGLHKQVRDNSAGAP